MTSSGGSAERERGLSGAVDHQREREREKGLELNVSFFRRHAPEHALAKKESDPEKKEEREVTLSECR